MRYLRPIPRRLLPDDMLVYPADGAGGFGEARLVRHVRLELSEAICDDGASAAAVAGRVFVDAVNSPGAFAVPAGSRVLIGPLPRMIVRSCKRCCVVRGQVHHWELEVG
jgi:hypothetical protein